MIKYFNHLTALIKGFTLFFLVEGKFQSLVRGITVSPNEPFFAFTLTPLILNSIFVPYDSVSKPVPLHIHGNIVFVFHRFIKLRHPLFHLALHTRPVGTRHPPQALAHHLSLPPRCPAAKQDGRKTAFRTHD